MAIDKDKIQAGNKAIEDYRRAHNQIHEKPWHQGVANEHEAIMQELISALKTIGFGSLQKYEDAVQDYLENGETVFRPSPQKVIGLIIPVEPLGKRFGLLAQDGSYDFTFVLSRVQNEAVIAEYNPPESYVDVDFCQANDIAITPKTYIGRRDYRYFYHRGTSTFNMGIDHSESVNGAMAIRLLRMTIVDVCQGFNLVATVQGNDIIVNDKKIAGATRNDLSAQYGRDASLVSMVFNVDFDVNLADGALRGAKRPPSGITSITGETGEPVDTDAYKKLFIESLAHRFNLQIEEEVWQP